MSGVPVTTILTRISQLDWSLEKAVDTPVKQIALHEYKGEKYTLRELAEKFGIDYTTLMLRVISNGWSTDRVVETALNNM